MVMIMKFKRIILVSIILLAILTIGTVSAEENATSQALGDDSAVDAPLGSVDEVSSDEIQAIEDVEILSDSGQSKQDLNMNISFTFGDEIAKFQANKDYYVFVDPIPENASGDNLANLYIDGNLYKSGYSVKAYQGLTFKATDLDYGLHNVTFSYLGNELYNPVNLTKSFEIVEAKIFIDNIDLTHYDREEGHDYTIRLAPDSTGTITFVIDGKEIKSFYFKDPSYEGDETLFRLSVPRLSIGTHNVTISYSGDKKYRSVVKNKVINVSYSIESNINYALDTHYENRYAYGTNDLIIFYLPYDVEKDAVILIDGKSCDFKRDANEFRVNISQVSIGSHNISITYPGDGKYFSSSLRNAFITEAKVLSNDWNVIEYYYLKLPKDATGNLTMYLSDKEFTNLSEANLFANVHLVDGYASISVRELPLLEHYININYTGDDYSVSGLYNKILIKPIVTYPEEMNYGDKKYVYINSSSVNNGTIRIKWDYEGYEDRFMETQLVNGCAKFSLEKIELSHAKNNVFYVYYGDYPSSVGMFSIVFNPIWKISASSSVISYYGDTITYKVKVINEFGKPCYTSVSFYLKGKYYHQNTDKNGIATFKISKLNTGKFTITPVSDYGNLKTKTVITVKKQSLTLKTVKVKKSAKKLVLTATLKKGKTPIKGKTVTFKFNGKTYNAKTNSKGIAKYTLKKSVLKKLKVGKTVKYQATYLKTVVKKSAKVKK